MRKLNKEERIFVIDRMTSEINIVAARKVARLVKQIADIKLKGIEDLNKLKEFDYGLEDKTTNEVEEFRDELGLDGFRCCEGCGKPFYEGFMWGDSAYCSVECLGLTEIEYELQYNDDDTRCAFFTEWEI